MGGDATNNSLSRMAHGEVHSGEIGLEGKKKPKSATCSEAWSGKSSQGKITNGRPPQDAREGKERCWHRNRISHF